MEISEKVLVAVISATPVLLAPLFSFLAQRQGVAQHAKELDTVEKRIEIIEHLLTLESHLADDKKRMLQAELADIAQELCAERVRLRAAGETDFKRLSFIKRLLLVYTQPTLRASIYRGIFWLFFFFGVFGGISVMFVGGKSPDDEWQYALIGGLFYIFIGFLFRNAARRQHLQVQESAAAK